MRQIFGNVRVSTLELSLDIQPDILTKPAATAFYRIKSRHSLVSKRDKFGTGVMPFIARFPVCHVA